MTKAATLRINKNSPHIHWLFLPRLFKVIPLPPRFRGSRFGCFIPQVSLFENIANMKNQWKVTRKLDKVSKLTHMNWGKLEKIGKSMYVLRVWWSQSLGVWVHTSFVGIEQNKLHGWTALEQIYPNNPGSRSKASPFEPFGN